MIGVERDGPCAPGRRPRRPATGVIGYAPGAFDLFHIGHLNLLRRARLFCDHLIAGVVSDEVARQQKGRWPVVHEAERLEIVSELDVVDEAVMEWTTDKLLTWERVRFDVIYKGDDWKGSQRWQRLERDFCAVGVRVVYLPYTRRVSTSRLRESLGDP